MLRQTANTATVTGRSSDGSPAYGAATALRCRVEHRSDLLVGDGETTATTVLWTERLLRVEDRVWLPGAATTVANAKRVLAVEEVPDTRGRACGFKAYL